MNKWIGKGRLTRDPEIRCTQSGKDVTSFSIACNRAPRKGDDKKQTADFVNCVAWDGLARTVATYLKKGREVLVEGRLQTRSYEAKDGSKRYVTEVILSNLEFCGKKDDIQDEPGGYGSGSGPIGERIPDDQIPF